MIRDMSLEFSESINVIEGQNEAGKSTLAAFIKYMLYGFDAEDGEDGAGERQKRLNWEDGTAAGSMTVLVKGKRYMITRASSMVESSPRPTYKEESSVIDLDTGSPAFGKVPAGEVFFCVDKELFENTAFIGQIGDSAINRGSVKESIENILFSGSERINNQRAAARVSEKMETLMHRGNSGGVIYDLERRSGEFEERFRRADEDNRLILAKEAKLHEIKSERREETKNEEKLTELDRCYENMVIIRTFDELHECEKRADEVGEAYRKFVAKNTKCDFVPSAKYLTDVAVARRGVDGSYRALSEAEDTYEAAKSAVGITHETENAIKHADEFGGESTVLSKASEYSKNTVKSIVAAVGGGLLAVAVILIEALAKGVLAHIALRILFALLGAFGVFATVYMLLSLKKNKAALAELENKFYVSTLSDLREKMTVIGEARKKRDNMVEAIEAARLSVERSTADYERAKKELAEAVALWGGEIPTENISTYLDKFENKIRIFLDEEAKIAAEKTELEISVREMRKSLSGKSEINIRAQVSPFKRKMLSGIDHEGIIEGIKLCREKIARHDIDAKIVEDELAGLKLRASDPAALYSKIQANDARIEELRREYEAHKLALDAINSAGENLREEISPRLGEYSTALMEIMTDKKYSAIDVSDGLKVSFTAPTGEKKSVDFLSGGTRDLTYIAVRMALIDMLYTEKPPICFDESFAHQDNLRARSMMKAVKSLEDDGHQCFIFTCRAREATLAKELSKKTEVFRLSAAYDAII